MGKKVQGAALRAKKRQRALVEELQEQQAEQLAKQPLVEKPDEELFVVDTTGDKVARNQRPKLPAKKKAKKETVWSENEKNEMDKLMKRYTKEQLAEMAKKGERLMDKNLPLRTHGIRKAKEEPKNFNLWDDGAANVSKKNAPSVAASEEKGDDVPSAAAVSEIKGGVDGATDEVKQPKLVIKGRPPGGTSTPLIPLDGAKKASLAVPKLLRPKANAVAVHVAKGGQSYRPDPGHHQKVLREALTVEERRNLAEAEKNAPISPGMSESTRALLLADSSDDDEDDDDDGDSKNDDKNNEEGDTKESGFHKRKEKLTRSQRNKKKRVRSEELERLNAKKRRIHENTVFQVARMKKELTQKEKILQERQEEKRKRAEERAAEDKGKDVETKLSEHDPIAAPTFPVALSSEFKQQGSSLRTMIPKGDLVTDRMSSLALRNLAPKLPSDAAAFKVAKEKRRKGRPKKKVKGGKEWVGENFVIIK